MAALKQYSQENGKNMSGEGSFRNGLVFPSVRSASEKPSLLTINTNKLEMPRNNLLNQITPKTDVKARVNHHFQSRNVHHDSLSLIPQPRSHMLHNHQSNNVLSNFSPLSAYSGNSAALNRLRQKKNTDLFTTSSVQSTEETNQEEAFKTPYNGSSPIKPSSRFVNRNSLKDAGVNSLNPEVTRPEHIHKPQIERNYRIISNATPTGSGPSFDSLMQKLGRISNIRSLLPNHEPTRGSDKSYGIIKGFGVCTNQGLVRNYNEDRVAIVLNIQRPNNKPKADYWPICNFFAVYDGHGGAKCADYLRNSFHQHVIRSPSFPWNPSEALNEAIEIADKEFIEAAAKDSGPHCPHDRSGSCALIGLFVDDVLYVANVGDSRAIISQSRGQKRYALTRDHKPCDPQEQARIIQAATRNFPLGVNGKRLDLDPASNPFKIEVPFRVMPGRLSVSRTIGDIEAKLPQYGGNPDVVISKPEITTLKITSEHDFIVLGCDGIFDKANNESLIQCVWDAKKTSVDGNVHEASKLGAENIIREAMIQNSMDNVTAIVISFAGLEGTQETQQPQQLLQSQQQQQPTLDKKFESTTPVDKGPENSEKTPITLSPLKNAKKPLELDDYGLSQEKPVEELAPYPKVKTARLSEGMKPQLSNGSRNYRHIPLLPDLRSFSTTNIYGQNSKINGAKNSPKSGL